MIVYDITKKQTFENAKFWLNQLKEQNAEPDLHIMLVGNKLDLVREDPSKR